MFKKLFIALVMVASIFTANAQKAVMYAGQFTYADEIPVSQALSVRSSIVSGIMATNRFDIVDADAESQLQKESERRASEEAMGDEVARTEKMQGRAAQYLLYGYVSHCQGIKVKKDDGGVAYSGEVKFTIKVVQAADKKVVASKDVTITGLRAGYGSTPEAAITDALNHVKNDMKNFIDENFKLKAVVLGEGFETKKDKEMLSCLITLGSDHGVAKGQRLDVSVVNIVAGRETNKVIGQITIKEVLAGDLSQCVVNKGGEEMMKAMQEYLKLKDEDPQNARELRVVTKQQSGMKNLLKQGAASFGL